MRAQLPITIAPRTTDGQIRELHLWAVREGLTFGYGTDDEATLARQHVMAALIGAETVRSRR